MSEFDDMLKDVRQSTDVVGMQKLGYAVAPSIAPTVLAGLGSVSPLGPWAGTVAGGMGGLVINKAIGLQDPSWVDYAIQAAVPPGMKTLGALKRVGSAFGERQGAEQLNRLGAPEIKALLDKYLPPTASKELFEQLVGHQANIPVGPYVQAIQKVKTDIGLSSPGYQSTYGGLKKNIAGSEQEITYDTLTKQPVLPADKLQREMHDVGKHTKAPDSMVRGEYRQLFGGLAKSLDEAALPGSKGEVLKQAREAFKREMVLKDIAKIARPFTMSGQGDVERFSANKIINRLKDPDDELAKFFTQSFSKEEQKDLMAHLTTLNKIPPIPAPKGADVGSKAKWEQASTILGFGGAGALAGTAAGQFGPEGAAAGVAIGYALPKLETMIRNYNIANNTIMGKQLIRDLWRQGGNKWSTAFWSALEGFVASQTAHPELFKMATGRTK